jgi:hydrogenase-4 membrane subunit HyfE
MLRMLSALTNKITMTQVATTHLRTLTEERVQKDGRVKDVVSPWDLALFGLFPILLGVAVWWWDVKAPDADPLLAATAVLTGLLFALIVLMFERVVHATAEVPPAAGNDPVTDAWQLLANVSWAILVSLIQLTVLFAITLLTSGALAPWLTAVVVALFAHLVLTLLMILKRVFSVAMRIAGYRAFTEHHR